MITTKIWLAIAWLLFPSNPIPAQTLRVEISGIRSDAGEVRVSFFTQRSEFDREAPAFEKVLSKKEMRKGQLTLTIGALPPGRYGIAVLDDLNANGRMDYGWLKPAEGYGFSGLVTRKLRRPHFDEFAFEMGGSDKTVTVALIYW